MVAVNARATKARENMAGERKEGGAERAEGCAVSGSEQRLWETATTWSRNKRGQRRARKTFPSGSGNRSFNPSINAKTCLYLGFRHRSCVRLRLSGVPAASVCFLEDIINIDDLYHRAMLVVLRVNTRTQQQRI